MIYRLVYVSKTDHDMSTQEISEILNTARRNNTRDQLSGLLIYFDRKFLQVIEGPMAQLEQRFAKIENDLRHSRVRVMAKGKSPERIFPSWKMGYTDPEELSAERRASVFELDKLAGERRFEMGENERVQMLVKNFLIGVRVNTRERCG